MEQQKADIIAALQKDILLRQGFRPALQDTPDQAGLGLISNAFPHKCFPIAAIHEFMCGNPEECVAASGFIAGILSSLMRTGGIGFWISPRQLIFPPALTAFGIAPHQVIFLDIKNQKQAQWAMEEALKCKGLAAVVQEAGEISFTESRRLQLAVEQTGVPGFLIRRNPKNLATAAVTRWRISPLSTPHQFSLPGPGHPHWKAELLKVRNGKPGSWNLQWREGRFCLTEKAAPQSIPLRKAG